MLGRPAVGTTARAHTHRERERERERARGEQRVYGDRERTDRAACECDLTRVSRQPARLEDHHPPVQLSCTGTALYSKYPVHHSIIELRYGLAALFIQQRTAERLFVGNMLQKY